MKPLREIISNKSYHFYSICDALIWRDVDNKIQLPSRHTLYKYFNSIDSINVFGEGRTFMVLRIELDHKVNDM